jgi:hypothetical protein
LFEFEKSPKPAYTFFLPKLIHNFLCENNISNTSSIFQNLAKESKQSPVGEKSPNLTTLLLARKNELVFDQSLEQGCQMVYFQTKNPNLGKFWRALDWTMLIYFMTIWNILRAF